MVSFPFSFYWSHQYLKIGRRYSCLHNGQFCNFLSTETGSFYGPNRNYFPLCFFPCAPKVFPSWSKYFYHHLPGEQSHGHKLTFIQPCPPRTVMRLSFSHTLLTIDVTAPTFLQSFKPLTSSSPLPHISKLKLFWEMLIHILNEEIWVEKNRPKDSQNLILKTQRKTPLK